MSINNETLGYSEASYRKAIRVLERIRKHILWKFAVVGGIANRAMFPEWAELNRGRRFNDIDLVLLPTSKDEGTAPLDVNLKQDYFITYIGQLARYFGTIDKRDYISVDIFTADRDLETQEMQLDGKIYTVLTPEERYLSMARDIYQTLTKDRILDPKHIKFLEFLENKINRKRLEKIWIAEAKIIKRDENFSFITFETYLDQIKRLINEKRGLIEEKIPGTQKRPYNIPRHEAFGITVEDEEVFHAAYEKKREMMES